MIDKFLPTECGMRNEDMADGCEQDCIEHPVICTYSTHGGDCKTDPPCDRDNIKEGCENFTIIMAKCKYREYEPLDIPPFVEDGCGCTCGCEEGHEHNTPK